MNFYIWMCVFAVVAVQCTTANSENALEIVPLTDELKSNNFISNCTEKGLYCKLCKQLVMCVETEYGWTEQLVKTCSDNYSCYNDECLPHVQCDGTSDIPFKCHVPGAFPDPFDCQAYHLCVLTTEQQGNDTIEVVKDFKHICPNDGYKKYRYDAKSTYCKYEFYNKCPKLPVPKCNFPGESGALIENESIYYICEQIDDFLYPNLYSCPHGRKYNKYLEKCEIDDYTTTEPPTTGYPEYTTGYPEYTTASPEYTTGNPEYTTGYPEYTTNHPEYTTGYPEYTTNYPKYTTGYPEYITGYPEYTTYRYPKNEILKMLNLDILYD